MLHLLLLLETTVTTAGVESGWVEGAVSGNGGVVEAGSGTVGVVSVGSGSEGAEEAGSGSAVGAGSGREEAVGSSDCSCKSISAISSRSGFSSSSVG